MITPDSRQASSGAKKTSFLPAPDFNPIYPSPNTLPARWRLSAVIFTLKELGWLGGIVRPFRTIAGMPDPHNPPPKVIQAVFGGGQ